MNSNREAIIAALHEVCAAARNVQCEFEHTPENWGGTNKTGIERAARAERQALRRLAKLIGVGALAADELEAIQSAYRAKT